MTDDESTQQRRRWCEGVDVVSGRGLPPGVNYRCRRCGEVWNVSGFMRSFRFGPCIDDAIPNWVGEGL